MESISRTEDRGEVFYVKEKDVTPIFRGRMASPGAGAFSKLYEVRKMDLSTGESVFVDVFDSEGAADMLADLLTVNT